MVATCQMGTGSPEWMRIFAIWAGVQLPYWYCMTLFHRCFCERIHTLEIWCCASQCPDLEQLLFYFGSAWAPALWLTWHGKKCIQSDERTIGRRSRPIHRHKLTTALDFVPFFFYHGCEWSFSDRPWRGGSQFRSICRMASNATLSWEKRPPCTTKTWWLSPGMTWIDFRHPSAQMDDTQNLTKHSPCAVKAHFPGQHLRHGSIYIYIYIYIYICKYIYIKSKYNYYRTH